MNGPAESSGTPPYRRITAAAEIVHFLKRLARQRSLVALTLPDSRGTFLSTILAVAPQTGEILLDELGAPAAHQELLTRRSFHADAIIDGVKLVFAGRLRDAAHTGDCYRVGLPRELLYYQQRAHYRARIALGQRVAVALQRHGGQAPLSGHLHDISVGGIGALIADALDAPVVTGDLLPGCLIQLPDNAQVLCAMEVRYVRNDPSAGLRVGGRFVDLDAQQQRTVERFVARMDREFLRRQAQRAG